MTHWLCPIHHLRIAVATPCCARAYVVPEDHVIEDDMVKDDEVLPAVDFDAPYFDTTGDTDDGSSDTALAGDVFGGGGGFSGGGGGDSWGDSSSSDSSSSGSSDY